MAGGFRSLMNRVNLTSAPEPEDVAYDDEYEVAQYESENELDLAAPNVVPMRPALAAADLSRILTVRPKRYGDTEMLAMADALRDGVPVIAHIGDMTEDDQRSFLCFLTGTTYALEGHAEHIAAHVFLVSPAEISVTDASGRVLNEEA